MWITQILYVHMHIKSLVTYEYHLSPNSSFYGTHDNVIYYNSLTISHLFIAQLVLKDLPDYPSDPAMASQEQDVILEY